MRISLRLPANYDGLVYLFDARYRPPAMRPHSHREVEAVLVLEGSMTGRVGDRRHILKAGCLRWVAPGIEHQHLDHSPTFRCLTAAFKPEMIRRLGFRPPCWSRLNREKFLVRSVSAADAAFLASVGHYMLDDYVDHRELNAGLGYGQDRKMTYRHADPAVLNSGLHFLLTTFWQVFSRGSKFQGSASLHPAVLRAMELMQNEQETLSLVDLAALCGISSSRLSRLFHLHTGNTLGEYRNRIRLDRFLISYDGGSRTVAEACFEAGFGSYAQFAKVFTRIFGMSPRKYAFSQMKKYDKT